MQKLQQIAKKANIKTLSLSEQKQVRGGTIVTTVNIDLF